MLVRTAQEKQLTIDSPWILMKHSTVIPGVEMAPATIDILAEHMRMVNICRLQLIRKRQDRQQEFLPRPGLLVQAAEMVKCIFGFNLERDGCLEKAAYNCEDCGAFCCDLHRFHSTHHGASPSDILRQQITAAAATSSTSAGPVNTSNSPSDTNKKKAPARNTRADLNQRFLVVTGRQTLDSKHKALKVKEFQLIVEGLERSGVQLATGTNIGSGATSAATIPPELESGSSSAPIILPPTSASSVSVSVNPAAAIPATNLSGSDQLMSPFLLAMLQSNSSLRDQMLVAMQSIINQPINADSHVLPSNTENFIDEVCSDDDNSFE